MKSLKQLWEENGCKPFDAIRGNHAFHCEALSPGCHAIGWDINGNHGNWFNFENKDWELITPKKKLYAYLIEHVYIKNNYYLTYLSNECPQNDGHRVPQFDIDIKI